MYGFFLTCHVLKTRFELSRVKLYRNDLKGIFELSRVRLTEGKITVNVFRKCRGNRLWFELARGSSCEGSSYRESSVDLKFQITYKVKNIYFLNWLE